MHKRGNISMLVMFVLLTCSLLGLLTVHFLKNMSTQYSQITAYYKTYYLAQAGIETALTQLQHRGLGFSETISSDSNFIRQNITQAQSSLSFEIVGKSNFLSKSLLGSGNCDSPYVLSSGQSFVLPLFVDAFSGSIVDSLSVPLINHNNASLLGSIKIVSQNPGLVNLGLLIADSTGMYENGLYFGTGSNWDSDFFKRFSTSASDALGRLEDTNLQNYVWQQNNRFSPYLIIANKDIRPVSFCLVLPKDGTLPTQQYLIKSFGVYGSTTLGLESTYKQSLPSFLIGSSFE